MTDTPESMKPKEAKDASAATDNAKPSWKHPLKQVPWRRKKKASPSKFSGLRRSKENPEMLAIKYHEESKLRILKLFLVVSVILGSIVAAVLISHKWSEDTARKAKVDAISAKIAGLAKKADSSSGYEREKTALQACNLIEDAMAVDYTVKTDFASQYDSFSKIVSQSFPVLKLPKGENFIAPAACLDMVHIPPGSFFMGRRSNEPGGSDELPRRSINIPYEFWMARTEITNRQFRKLLARFHVPEWKKMDFDGDHQPAVTIDWNTATLFCKSLTDIERKAGRIPEKYEYRLPTEAEWEYACRAGTETYFYFSDSFPQTGAQFSNTLDELAADTFNWKGERGMAKSDGFLITAPVAYYSPNAFGLYDMTGNAWEWCYDWYNPAAYRELPDIAPVQLKPLTVKLEKFKAFDAGTFEMDVPCKVLRGGSWGNLPSKCHSATRDYSTPDDKNNGVTFRIVLAPIIKEPVKTSN